MSNEEKILELLQGMSGDISELKQGQARMEKRLDSLEEKVDRLEEKVDSLEQKVDSLEQKVDSLEQKVDRLEQRVDSLEQRVGSLEQRVGSLERDVSSLKSDMRILKQKVSDLDQVQAMAVLHQETDIIPKLQLIHENQILLLSTKADKAEVEALWEELSVQKTRIDALAELVRR